MGDMGEIVRGEGEQYLQTHRVTPQQRKALGYMARCRTESMGLLGKVACEECGTEYPIFRSCRNRNCPGCQAEARAAWLEAREQELLDVPYFHVVFTVPEELNVIALWCPEVFYAALLQAAGKALLDVGFTKLQARLAVLAILHTWGQNLWLHPPRVVSPFAVSSSFGDIALGLYDGRIQLLFVGLVLLILRFRRSSIEQRQQIKWVLSAVVLMAVVQFVPPLLSAAGAIPASASSAASPYLQTPILTVTLVVAIVATFRHRAAVASNTAGATPGV